MCHISDINLFAYLVSSKTSVSANDGKWHHICATWENTAGSWKLYQDGKVAASGKSLKTGKDKKNHCNRDNFLVFKVFHS